MTLEEVLKLDIENSSIKRIDLFLADKKQTSYEYIKALSYKCLILHSLGNTKDALKTLLTQTTHFKLFESKSIVSICEVLIEIFLAINNDEQALNYIDIKRDHLEEIDKEEYILDLIKYYNHTKNNIEAKRNILIYLKHDVEESKKIYAYEILINLQYADYEYEKFYETFTYLEEYYLRTYEYDKLQNLLKLKLEVLIKDNKQEDAIVLIKKILNDKNSEPDILVSASTLLMNIYYNNDEIRKAVIIESEYQEYLNDVSKETAIEFCKIAKSLYEKLNNRISILAYEEKLELYNEEKKEIKKHRKSKVNYDILINEAQPIDVGFEEAVVTEYPKANITANYKKIESIIKTFSIAGNIRFRDVFRNFSIELEQIFGSLEIVLAFKDETKGFHYKKQRLYEKNFSDNELEDTPLFELIDNSKHMFLPDIKQSLFNKNIITNAPYQDEFMTLIGFRLYRDDECLGAIIYQFFTDQFSDSLIYENLKMLTSLLNIHLNVYINEQNKDANDKMREFILTATSNGIKYEKDHEIKLNKQAIDILGFDEDIDSNFYISRIDSSDVAIYKKTMEKIYNNELDNVIMKYHISNKYIKESIYVNRNSYTHIYSIIEDISLEEQKENELINLVYNDSLSKISTKIKLFVDIENQLKYKKFSIVLIDISNFKLYSDIYGFSFTQEIIYAIGNKLSMICEKYNNAFCYHLEGDKFALLFKNVNDLRLVSRTTKEILNHLSEDLYGLNKRLKLYFKAGIFRYIKTMTESKIDKLIYYASEALLDAKENKEEVNVVMVYDEAKSKKRFIESQIVLHISEAIDNNLINLRYKQIVNINENLVDQYLISINMSNFTIEENAFNEVIVKRNLKELIDKYIIQHITNEMKIFYENSGRYIRVMLPIYKSTMLSENFIGFLEGKLNFFGIPSKLISFNIIEDDLSDISHLIKYFKSKYIKLASNNFDFVIRNKLDIYFCDISRYENDLISLLKDNCERLNIDVLGMGINSEGNINRCRELKIDSIQGDYFKKLFTLKELLNSVK